MRAAARTAGATFNFDNNVDAVGYAAELTRNA